MENIINKIEELPFILEFKKILRKKTYKSSTELALKTVELFEELIKDSIDQKLIKNYRDLLTLILHFEKVFTSIDPLQFSVGNSIKRILFMIREEEALVHPLQGDNKKETSFKVCPLERTLTFSSLNSVIDFKKLKFSNSSEITKKNEIFNLKSINEDLLKEDKKKKIIFNESDYEVSELKNSLSNILDNIAEFKDELEMSSEAIKSQALEYIKNNDIILTSNHSEQLEDFFIEAHKYKKFKVIVAESSPLNAGMIQAKKLISNGIDTKVISDNAVFAIIHKVNKVIIGTRAIISNGGLISYNGAYNLCLCAKVFSVPVVVVGATFKLTPAYPFGHESINEYLTPDVIINDKIVYNKDISNIIFNTPAYDYVPPNLVSIYITNNGNQNPNNIYRLFSELYSQEDYFS